MAITYLVYVFIKVVLKYILVNIWLTPMKDTLWNTRFTFLNIQWNFSVRKYVTLFKTRFPLILFSLYFFEWTIETKKIEISWHFDCLQKNPKGSFYELRKGLLHAMCSRIKIKAFLVPKCIKGEKTLKLCRSLLNHFGLRSILKKHGDPQKMWVVRHRVIYCGFLYSDISSILSNSSSPLKPFWSNSL